MEFTANNLLTVVCAEPMLTRFHEEIERSLLRLQEQGLYSQDAAVERFTKLVRAARIKMGWTPRRGRPSKQHEYERSLAIDVFLDTFEKTHPYILAPPAKEPLRVHHFTPPKVWPPEQSFSDLVYEIQHGKPIPPREIDEFDLLRNHEPDLEGVGESAFYISCSQSLDPRSEHPVPELPDPYEGLDGIEAVAKEFQASVFMNHPADDPYALLSWQSRSYLRHLDVQTYEDYLLDHADELAEENGFASTLATNPPGSEGSNGTVRGPTVEEMWNDWIRRYPPLQRLELLKRYANGGED